jgi:hypothetical protein
MESTRRRLVSIRRYVPLDSIRDYAELWVSLHRAATARGAHAWHFTSADQPNVYLEFLEFGADSDVRNDTETVAAIKALHERFGEPYPTPLTLEEWVELPAPPRIEPA